MVKLIIEEGGRDQIAVLILDGVIQDTGNASSFFIGRLQSPIFYESIIRNK